MGIGERQHDRPRYHPGRFAIRNIAIASGRVFDQDECRGRRRVAVVGPTVVENLFLGADPIGLTFRIGRVPFEVIGVTEPKGVDANGLDQDDVAIVPLDTAMRRLMNVDYVQTIYVQWKSSDVLDQAETEIRELLRQRHRLGRQAGRFHDPEPSRAAGNRARDGPIDDAVDRQRFRDFTRWSAAWASWP